MDINMTLTYKHDFVPFLGIHSSIMAVVQVFGAWGDNIWMQG